LALMSAVLNICNDLIIRGIGDYVLLGLRQVRKWSATRVL